MRRSAYSAQPSACARGAGQQASPRVELCAVVHRLRDLQVMSRHALVVDGGQLAPGVELVDALGHRPPHATRTREVIGGTGVVDAALVGRRDHALQSADRVGDVEVRASEFFDRTVAGLLHPLLQRFGAVELAGGVGLQEGDGLLDRGAGLDLVRDRLLLGDHARELLDAPFVRLVEVDRGAEEAAGLQRVELAADRVLVARGRGELGAEEPGELVVRDACGVRVVGEVAGEGCRKLPVRGCGVSGEGREEPVLVGVARDLRDHFEHLTTRRNGALRRSPRAAFRCSRRSPPGAPSDGSR